MLGSSVVFISQGYERTAGIGKLCESVININVDACFGFMFYKQCSPLLPLQTATFLTYNK